MNTIEKERQPKVLTKLVESRNEDFSPNALVFADDKENIHVVDKDEDGYILRGYTKDHIVLYVIAFDSKENAINHLEKYWDANPVEVESPVKKNSIWQTLMDVPYAMWKEGEYKTYGEMLKDISELEADAVLLGNLNYQVNNGGFFQWVDNRYAIYIRNVIGSLDRVYEWINNKYKGTGESHSAVCEVRKMLIKMLPYINENPNNDEGWIYSEDDYEEDCKWCNGEGTMMEARLYPQGHTEVDVECEECGGLGYTNEYDQYCHGVDIANNSDGEFFKLNDEFIKDVGEYFESKVV